jgi:hypothetical protein
MDGVGWPRSQDFAANPAFLAVSVGAAAGSRLTLGLPRCEEEPGILRMRHRET